MKKSGEWLRKLLLSNQISSMSKELNFDKRGGCGDVKGPEEKWLFQGGHAWKTEAGSWKESPRTQRCKFY